MPHISQIKTSNFLTKEDCGRGILLTIKGCIEENVAKKGAAPEMKWCLEFYEQEKPMVLNSTNAQIIAKITNSENTDDWTNHKIVCYNDPNISFQGKLTGGIRVRAPRPQGGGPAIPPPKKQATPPPQQEPQDSYPDENGNFDESIPFSVMWAMALMLPFLGVLA